MNLLPVPRTLELTDRVVPEQSPVTRIDGSLPAQGYELRIGPDGVDLVAADDAGAFYGRATLAQLARIHDGSLPVGRIADHPDLAVRGVMLDISRDKVPTTASLERLIDLLASLKVNQVQLYSEHTFAYRNHPTVHAGASPLDAEEIRRLDAFCRARHVELVPNQNCLGHMNRWLAHEPYRHLAIRPDGFVDPYGITRPPMTIEPTNPGSLALVRELLAELLPLFTSRRVHVGLDEAWELPAERMDDFLAWVATLRALPELEGREMLMWGDMLAGRADLLGRLPGGVTVCEWGYDDWHPFDERCAVLAESGVPFWVAPGTSAWLTILGRVTNARATCRKAAEAALAHGATGYLNTDWGDQGHLQQPDHQRAGAGLRRRRVLVPRGQRRPRPRRRPERARLRRRHRGAGRGGAGPGRRPPAGHAAVPQHVDPGHEPLLPPAPGRTRPDRGHHGRGADGGGGVLRRRPHVPGTGPARAHGHAGPGRPGRLQHRPGGPARPRRPGPPRDRRAPGFGALRRTGTAGRRARRPHRALPRALAGAQPARRPRRQRGLAAATCAAPTGRARPTRPGVACPRRRRRSERADGARPGAWRSPPDPAHAAWSSPSSSRSSSSSSAS